jgi:integrase
MRSWPAPAAGPRWSPACHELRHTCLTRLREAGMALEAVQAQAGHRSIEAGPGLPAPSQ